MDLKPFIRDVPDFPKKGIVFKDITPLLLDGDRFHAIAHLLKEQYKDRGITKIAAMESRGFIFGALAAYKLHAGFVPLRKPGKLPHATVAQEFSKEYGTDSFEMHLVAIQPGDKVLIVDDVLATGGTARAAIDLVEKQGGEVFGLWFLIELGFLHGRQKLKGHDISSQITYDDD